MSPIDYSPLIIAELRAASASSRDAPSALVMRCRGRQAEISLRTTGTWRPRAAGNVDVAVVAANRGVSLSRWSVAADGRSATSGGDAADAMLGRAAGSLSVTVTDAMGNRGTARFELAGTAAVRTRIAAACRSSLSGSASSGR
jgi:hypothetical protein